MAENYEALAKKSVADLRAMAKEIEHDALAGFNQLDKGDLLRALCTAKDLEIPAHRREPGVDRKAVKGRIQELKVKRQAALDAHDHEQLARTRRRINRLKRKLRAASL